MSQEQTKKLEAVIQKHKNLSKLKIQLETEIQSLELDYQKAFREAKDLYGIESIDELRSLYLQKAEDNKLRISEFENTINEIEAKVQEISKGV